MGLLIKNVTIVTMDEDMDIIDEGYIYIMEDKIQYIGKGEFSGAEESYDIIDGKGYCAIPGLINGHTHAAMTLLRGYGEGLPLMRWLNEKIWPMESKFREEHISVGAKLACLEMLRTGTTTFNDMYFFQDEVLKVAEEFNVRAVLGLPIIGEGWQEQLKAALRLNSNIRGKVSNSKIVKTMLAPHSPYTLSYDALKEIGACANDENMGIHIHVSETQDELEIIKEKYNKTSCELLYEAGIFDNRVVAAHCVHLTDGDMDILKAKEVSTVYNPQSNMKLASGVPRIVELLGKGINVCFGTDGTSSNNNLNMFEEMETGSLLQKLWYKDPTKLDGKTVLSMATAKGAKALNYENLGVLKEGYLADIVLLNLNKYSFTPLHDIYSNIVFSANGSEVETVIVNGKVVMEKGEFKELDEEKILHDCNKLCQRLI